MRNYILRHDWVIQSNYETLASFGQFYVQHQMRFQLSRHHRKKAEGET